MNPAGRLRPLPVRVPVAAGESLHSWIEAVAARYAMTVRELLPALDLAAPRTPYGLVRGIGGETLRSLERQADLPGGALDEAVLDRYAGLGLVGPAGRRPPEGRHSLWARGAGSGFCPRCLAETGGRWPVAWHLNWTFACTRHRVLLAARCAACGRRPRSGENRLDHVIDPRRCCHAAPGPGAGRPGPGMPRCGADLSGQPVPELPGGHPVLACQGRVNGILAACDDGRHIAVAGMSVPPQAALAAAAALVRYAVLQPGDLAARPVSHLSAGPAGEGLRLPAPGAPGSPAGAFAAAAEDPALFAAAAVLAADVLAAPTLQAAADTVTWMLAPAGRRGGPGKGQWLSKLDAAATGSPVVDAIVLRQRAPRMTPALRLSYRTEGAVPRRPDAAAEGGWPFVPGRLASVPARLVPQTAWPAVAAALPRHAGQDTGARGAALAMMTVRCGTYAEWPVIASWLMLPPQYGRTITSVLHGLDRDGHLDDVLAGIDALAAELAANPPPVDYARRRKIFRDLEPVTLSRLRRACRSAGLAATGRRRRFATMMLWETLTGGDVRFAAGQLAPRDAADRSEYASFRDGPAAGLGGWLALEAERLLLRHRIDEPVTWQPEPAAPGGRAWKSPPPDLARRLPGWTSPSRQGTLRRSARDHTPAAGNPPGPEAVLPGQGAGPVVRALRGRAVAVPVPAPVREADDPGPGPAGPGGRGRGAAPLPGA